MLAETDIDAFAADWIAAWNSHDLDRILAHYDEAFEFSSPVLARLLPASAGRLQGTAAARAYWRKALAARPALQFELLTVFKGVQSAVLHYRGDGGRLCAEFFVFGTDGKVVSSHVHGE